MESYKPTAAMKSAAKRGLEMRERQPPSNRGGTDVGIARARDIIAGKDLPLDTVKRMYSFFSRHEVDKSSESWKKGESKGEQAWLLWGGDAGYSWSKSIVEKEKKKDNTPKTNNEVDSVTIRVNLQTTINAERVRIDKTMENGEPIWYLRNHKWLVDGIVLNSGIYPKDENEKAFTSMNGKLFTNGHPKVDGQFVTIANQDNERSNRALESHYMYASNTNVRKEGSEYFKDIRIRVNLAKKTEGGKKLIEWCEKVANGEKPPCINTSTGLLCNKKELQGNSRGKNYTWVATDQRYDHDAFLLNEAGAGGDEIALAVNGDQIDCLTVNLDQAVNAEEQSDPVTDENTKTLLEKIANKLGISVKSTPKTNTGAQKMQLSESNKAMMVNFLLGVGDFVGNESDEEIVDKFKKKHRDQDKAGGVPRRVEEEEEEEEEEELDENKKKAKNKKTKSSACNEKMYTEEELNKMIDARLAANQAQSEQSAKESVVNSLIANGAYPESSKASLMQTPLDVLNGMNTYRSVGIAPGAATQTAFNSEGKKSFTTMKMEGAE